ncbi:flagellin N-terminal helical domain-containing protein [Marinimicrobium sp. C2-29]|uniref:flagellin N-terminal helical domain-containing protein n=1 Tax=Marinimicrobium sp. C2-29 TaxID=3139825 RepID=UPI0031397021
MALVINTNVASLNAQRQLMSSGNALDQATERLSSGQRINSAKDDAAGLAISNRMTSQVRGLDQAIRNANDGVSMIQTAEGALQEVTNILQRMRELSVQSANGIYTDSDRQTLDAEVQQMVEEIDRISETTSFNGQKLLDGSLGSVALQVGDQSNQTIELKVQSMDSSSLGLGSTSSDLSGGAVSTSLSIGEGDVLINDQALGAHDFSSEPLNDLIKDINDNIEGVSASGFNVFESGAAGTGVLAAGDTFTISVGSTDGSDPTVYTIGGPGIATTSRSELEALINEKTGGAVSASFGEDGKLSLSNDTGGSITVAAGTATDAEVLAATGFNTAVPAEATQAGSIALTSDDGSAITVSKGASGEDADLGALGFNTVSGAGEVLGTSLGSVAQGTALEAGALVINGTSISATDADNLATKVENINAVSDETGVTASIVAEQSFSFDGSVSATQITGSQTSSTLVTGGALSVNGFDVTLTAGDTWAEVASDINAQNASTGVTAYVDSAGELNLFSESAITLDGGTTSFAADSGITAAPTTVAASAVSTGSLSINSTSVTLSDLTDIEQVLSDINAQQASTGVRASIDDNGQLQFKSNSTMTLSMGSANGLESAAALGITFDQNALNTADGANDTFVVDPRIALDSANDQSISIEVTGNGTTATGLTNLNTEASTAQTGSAISNISIATQSGAQSAIDAIDTAIGTIGEVRADLGAANNRLDFTVSNLSNISEKTSAARSRILDADFAAETAALSKAQVLQQASQAMLAQANARPQQVLQLLQ